MIKSQNFEIVYKIKVKNWTFLYLVIGFYNKRVKFQAARAFADFVRQIEATAEKVSEFLQPWIFGILGAWLSDKLMCPNSSTPLCLTSLGVTGPY